MHDINFKARDILSIYPPIPPDRWWTILLWTNTSMGWWSVSQSVVLIETAPWFSAVELFQSASVYHTDDGKQGEWVSTGDSQRLSNRLVHFDWVASQALGGSCSKLVKQQPISRALGRESQILAPTESQILGTMLLYILFGMWDIENFIGGILSWKP